MYFKIRYFRNPLDNATPYKSGEGEQLLNKGTTRLKRKIINPRININVDKSAKLIIHGFAYIFGFRFRSFLKDNFNQVHGNLCVDEQECTLITWCSVLPGLNKQLKTIHQYHNLSSLLRSRYAKYLQIANLSRYYHTRRKFVKNARTQLLELGENKRYTFTGEFIRFGSKTNGQLTILLQNIQYHGKYVTSHLWFNATKGFKRLGHLNEHEQLSFHARVQPYTKGRLIRRHDFMLSYPTQIHRIE